MKRRDEVLVGIFATIALGLGAVGAIWLAQGGLVSGYPLYAKFAWGAGLKQGQPVLLSGVTVGYVHDVILRPDGMLVVELRIRNQFKVPQGTSATVEPNGFFGDQLVALHPARPTTQMYAASDTVMTGRATPSIADVLSRVDTISGRLSILAAALTRELVDRKGFEDVHNALNSANAMFAEVQRVAALQSAELSRTQVALRRAAGAIDSVRIDSTLRSLQDASQSIKTFTSDLRGTAGRVDSLLARVNSGRGSLGRAIDDPGLYDDLRHSLQRLDSLMADFQKNPRKYFKFSIF